MDWWEWDIKKENNMDYEKAYKDALERAKSFELPEYKNIMVSIFPELAESEDERIRKEIISALKFANVKGVYDKHIAWLEKQGKYKDYYTKQELIDMGFSFTLNGDIVTPDEMMEDMKKYLAWKEKQGDQKPIDKVEPKFKVGDVVIWDGEEYTLGKVRENTYCIGEYDVPIYTQDESTLLTESEDERIKKEILELVSISGNGNQFEEIKDWLEKQESIREIVERCKNSWYNEGKIAGQFEGLTNDEKYQQGYHDALEKQGEQQIILDELEMTLSVSKDSYLRSNLEKLIREFKNDARR